jgi:hypothetical protein
MTEYMEGVSDGSIHFDYESNKINFEKVFFVLNKSHENKIFARIGKENNLQNNFNIYHFESITMGIQDAIELIDIKKDEDIQKVKDSVIELKNDENFKAETTGGGKNSTGLLRRRIELAQQFFLGALQ